MFEGFIFSKISKVEGQLNDYSRNEYKSLKSRFDLKKSREYVLLKWGLTKTAMLLLNQLRK